jgi:NADPH:quinone reductase-like Zn-dependent oxidoreductase
LQQYVYIFYRKSRVHVELPATRDLAFLTRLLLDFASRRLAVKQASSSHFTRKMLTIDLSDHLALVTGGTGGIGKATCLALASLGCSIAVHYNTAADTAEEVVKQLEAKGVKAKTFQANLSNYDDVSVNLGNTSGAGCALSDYLLYPRSVAYTLRWSLQWETLASCSTMPA